MIPALIVFAYLGLVLYIGIFAFRRGVYSYTVYSKVARSADGEGPQFEDGVIVARRGKVISKMRCADGGEGFREPVTAVKSAQMK